MEQKLGKMIGRECTYQGETYPAGFMRCDGEDKCIKCVDGKWVEGKEPKYTQESEYKQGVERQ